MENKYPLNKHTSVKNIYMTQLKPIILKMLIKSVNGVKLFHRYLPANHA